MSSPIFHKTQSLTSMNVEQLFRVATVIYTDFLVRPTETPDSLWLYPRIHKGSFTIQQQTRSHQVIKLFVDHGKRLITRAELGVPNKLISVLDDAPVLVGIEVDDHEPFMREAIRNHLRHVFGLGYCDPRPGAGSCQVRLKPDRFMHPYDIVIPFGQPCKVDEDVLADIKLNAIMARDVEESVDHLISYWQSE
jgi:hypothetical protein